MCSPSRTGTSRLKACGPLLLVLLFAACDAGEPCTYDLDRTHNYLALVAHTDGTIQRTFPLAASATDPAFPTPPDARLTLVSGRYLLASSSYLKRLYDLETGRILATLPPEYDLAAVSRAEARSRIGRASSKSYFCIPGRSA